MNDEKPNYFAVIPANVRYDKEIKANEKLLYGEIFALTQKEGMCWASNNYFAKLYDVCSTTISKWINHLAEKGYITIELVYNNETKEIEKRLIGIAQNDNTYCSKEQEGIVQMSNRGIVQKSKDNNTSINNINNNKKESKKEVKTYEQVLKDFSLSEKLTKCIMDFIQMRKFIKKPLTNRGLELMIGKLKKMSSSEIFIVVLLTAIIMVVAAVLAKPMANKFGKAEIGAVSSVAAALINIALLIIRPANVWVYSGLQAVSWLGLGMFSMVSWALITDVIDATEIQNGVREDGSVYALYSWARKLGQAASAGLTGGLLSLIGYTDANAFEPHITKGIFNISCLVPAIGFLLLGLILWFWYPLHKKQVDANVAALKEKHGN